MMDFGSSFAPLDEDLERGLAERANVVGTYYHKLKSAGIPESLCDTLTIQFHDFIIKTQIAQNYNDSSD